MPLKMIFFYNQNIKICNTVFSLMRQDTSLTSLKYGIAIPGDSFLEKFN